MPYVTLTAVSDLQYLSYFKCLHIYRVRLASCSSMYSYMSKYFMKSGIDITTNGCKSMLGIINNIKQRRFYETNVKN